MLKKVSFLSFFIIIPLLIFNSCSDNNETKVQTCKNHSDCKDNKVCLFDDAKDNYSCQDSCDLNTNCMDNKVCESLENTDLKACFSSLSIKGQILNNDDNSPIKDAFVTLFKTDNTFISSTAITDETGNYTISVPVLRNNKGEILETEKDIFYKLRVSALNFQEYPSFIRVAIPFKLDTILEDEDKSLIYSSTLTTINLFPLNYDNLKIISGKLSEELAGVLVVAENNTNSSLNHFGYTDTNGNFNIVNLTSGDYKLVAYIKGYNFSKEDVTLSDENLENIVLDKIDSPLGSISGKVQIVNGGEGKFTSIVIVPESTFNDSWRKGEFAPSLRAPEPGIEPNIDGDYKIENIPEGNYVILAAFENDKLVQDPDTSISGTQILHFSIPDGNNYDLIIDGFKITGALDILSPGGTSIEEIESLTEFKWIKDSSEDGYDVELFDSFGNKIFEKTVPKATERLDYDGEILKKGYYYQWKVTSFSEKNGKKTNISRSEDLKGIFYIK